ncbi:TIGR03943 family protein [Clostridium sp. SHJSY1]|uniref:TIGR03943 family putative permease subunit n=1 Tax=Clostridium sp. SHJSY1 TaxID=2942483 RepID=UPI00287709F3|nr:TIGR03943 family protein [Clostridium sp. SHJSY1]MDS0524664.1 TIGR03943 family protein [Clostridium sp. SHJSY1]
MKKVNFEVMFKLLILLGFSLFYFILVKNDTITLYVHPRIVPFAKVSIVAMMFIVLFLAFDILKAKTVKRKMRNYIVFIIPFLMMLGMKPNSNNGAASNNSSFLEDKSDNTKSTQDNKINDAININNNSDDERKVYLDENGKIKITDKNYVNFLTEVENNIDNYVNKDIEIVGFVYKEQGMNEKQFALVRNMMVCCTADMQMVGLLCESEETIKYELDTWLKVNGTIEKSPDNNDVMVKIKKMEKVDAPKTPYVYPY